MASLAGFWLPDALFPFEDADEFDGCEYWLVEADVMDSAEVGRVKGLGDGARDCISFELVVVRSEEGCCRTWKTKVLLNARRTHWGCATYRS